LVRVLIFGVVVFQQPIFANDPPRPNILFAIADDWGWPHAGAYGDAVVQTPAFDQIAREGVLFENAFVSAPSCTPSRNAILTGQYHWRLGWGGNLHSRLDIKHQTYPHRLEANGYFTGHWRKSWGPGKVDNWDDHPQGHPAGKKYNGFDQFLEDWPRDQPFCFWLGSSDPHRPYEVGSGRKRGMDLSQVHLFPHFPDHEIVRSDIADYYYEVERFDHDVAEAMGKLELLGLLDNTIVVMTGDHGMPFPRCKANLYDCGTHVPMAVRWPAVIQSGRVVTDFVSTTDLAPTFLEAADVAIPAEMTGRSWMPLLTSLESGRIEPQRDHVLTGKERHVPAQEAPDSGGTPMRSIRTDQFLLIHNYRPDRWPAGTPNFNQAYIPGCWLADCDNGPTKTFLVEHQDRDDEHRKYYELSFGKRPEFELYNLANDPDQLMNVSGAAEYASIESELLRRLDDGLLSSEDPRALGTGDETFDTPAYFGHGPRHPSFKN
jgi:arylsulfatase A-like enzyme